MKVLGPYNTSTTDINDVPGGQWVGIYGFLSDSGDPMDASSVTLYDNKTASGTQLYIHTWQGPDTLNHFSLILPEGICASGELTISINQTAMVWVIVR